MAQKKLTYSEKKQLEILNQLQRNEAVLHAILHRLDNLNGVSVMNIRDSDIEYEKAFNKLTRKTAKEILSTTV